jgi:hypothetical protein
MGESAYQGCRNDRPKRFPSARVFIPHASPAFPGSYYQSPLTRDPTQPGVLSCQEMAGGLFGPTKLHRDAAAALPNAYARCSMTARTPGQRSSTGVLPGEDSAVYGTRVSARVAVAFVVAQGCTRICRSPDTGEVLAPDSWHGGLWCGCASRRDLTPKIVNPKPQERMH